MKYSFTLSELNAAIAAFNWPMGHRVPPMDKRILKGKAGSRTPLESSTIASSASQTLHLALNKRYYPEFDNATTD